MIQSTTPTTARRDPAEMPDLDVGRRVVDDRVDRHRDHQRRGPAQVQPDRRGAVAEPDLAEHVGGEPAAEEDQHERDQRERHDDQRPRQVLHLAPDEPAPFLDAEDLVQRPPGGAERARRAVERDRKADDQRDDGLAALVLGGLQRAGHGIDGVLRRAGVVQIGGRVVDQALLAEHAEHGGAEQQRREQREQRVVRQSGRVVGDLVLAKARERALEVPEGQGASGLAAVRDGRRFAGETAQTPRLPPQRLPMPYPPLGMPASRTRIAAMIATIDGRPRATHSAYTSAASSTAIRIPITSSPFSRRTIYS